MNQPTRLKNLYTHLVTNRIAHLNGWLGSYEKLRREVDTVAEALRNGSSLKEKEAYAGTRFFEKDEPWQSFARLLIYNDDNGISTSGFSFIREDNFDEFANNEDFIQAFEGLIKETNRASVEKFTNTWESIAARLPGKGNPLRINRVIAACSFDVSSTVNGADFETAFWWLVREKLIPPFESDNGDWYAKNRHLMSHLQREFEGELASSEDSPEKVSPALLSIFVWEISQNITSPFSLKKQIIKHGAPGTGKTFSAKQNARLLFSIWQEQYGHLFPETAVEHCLQVVQFHPSYGYEDFIEGLRPMPGKNDDWQLRLQNGIFKDFCKQAARWELEVLKIPKEEGAPLKHWEDLEVRDIKAHVGHHLKDPSWLSIAECPESVKIADIVPPYFFIIDEINRAELSRVLGELMLCLEYRGIEGAISTQYSSLNTAETALYFGPAGARFFIPHNVYLIGTMNTIDRSVESFDLALRRRFRWEPVVPDMQVLRYYLQSKFPQWSQLADNTARLNEKIRVNDLLGPDYEIGHVYLMNLRYPPSLSCREVRARIWEDSLQPLLEEYLRGSGKTESLMKEFIKAFGL